MWFSGSLELLPSLLWTCATANPATWQLFLLLLVKRYCVNLPSWSEADLPLQCASELGSVFQLRVTAVAPDSQIKQIHTFAVVLTAKSSSFTPLLWFCWLLWHEGSESRWSLTVGWFVWHYQRPGFVLFLNKSFPMSAEFLGLQPVLVFTTNNSWVLVCTCGEGVPTSPFFSSIVFIYKHAHPSLR